MEMRFVQLALNELAHDSPIWAHNRHIFHNMPVERQEHWWQHVQQMSDSLPMYRLLVAKTIQIRMT